MVYYINLLSLNCLNRLDIFSKFEKNNTIFIISNTFILGANYIISKTTTKLLSILLI